MEDGSDDDASPEEGMDTLSASTLALLLEFLPNRRFEGEEPSNDTRYDSQQACVAYTAGDVTVITETLKRLADKHEERDARLKEIVDQRVFLELMPSAPGAEALSTIIRDGVVRINSILTYPLCDKLLSTINTNLAYELSPAISNPQTIESGFGNVLCRDSRWDMYLHDEGVFHDALLDMFRDKSGPLGRLFDDLFDGEDAGLHEFSALISDSGSVSQPIHPDSRHPHTEEGFSLLGPMYTVFVALQNIEKCMGPTIFLPRTNTQAAHTSHQANVGEREKFLAGCEHRVSCLKKGDAAVMDSRCLHGGDANTSTIPYTGTLSTPGPAGRRVLMYCTVRHPKLYPLCVPPIPPGSKWAGLDINLSDLRG